jgi:glycosyltransferase involved in cell wall biosynthesis
MATRISVVVTTLNNADTLGACLGSVTWADECVVLDSFSTDETLDIARAHDARVLEHEFQGYSRQKQMAIDAAAHDWVLLLDADEVLSEGCAKEIQTLLESGPEADAYTLQRIEQLFWRWPHPRVRMNHFLRLFDRRCTAMNDVPIHAAPESTGRVRSLLHGFYHYGEPDIHTKVEKLNHYSSGLVETHAARGRSPTPWLLLAYPLFFFVKSYFFKRNFLSGWAGFIGSVCIAFYAFMKIAKAFEHYQPSGRTHEGGAGNAPAAKGSQPGAPANSNSRIA